MWRTPSVALRAPPPPPGEDFKWNRSIVAAVAPALLLTGCDYFKVPDKVADAKAAEHSRAIGKAEGKIECSAKGETAFAYVCAIDRTETQDGLFLTLRHPDGGFRRLLVTKDGRGVVAADGAEEAVVTVLAPDLIEVALGGARYRLPATVGDGKKPAATPEPAGKAAK